MKKILVCTGLLLAGLSGFAQEQFTYSPAYLSHLKACSAYSEDYTANIPTGDENSPVLKVKSTEQILGYINGKCYTKSTVYSLDLNKEIMTIKCGLTRDKLTYIVNQMNAVNSQTSKEAKKHIQEELTKIIENKEICRVKNYLEEDK